MSPRGDEPRPPDEYEAEFMGRGEEIVHREKLSYPRWFQAFLAVAVAMGLGLGAWGSFQAGDMAALALMAGMMPVMAFFIMMASTLRVTVTRDHVNVQYGPIGPRIPIDKIEHCEAEDYAVWKYGGYGIRYSLIEGAWCYNMVGDKGKAVRVHYRTASGALKKVLIASPRHHALADAINRARAGKGHDVGVELADDAEDVIFVDETSRDEATVDDEVSIGASSDRA